MHPMPPHGLLLIFMGSQVQLFGVHFLRCVRMTLGNFINNCWAETSHYFYTLQHFTITTSQSLQTAHPGYLSQKNNEYVEAHVTFGARNSTRQRETRLTKISATYGYYRSFHLCNTSVIIQFLAYINFSFAKLTDFEDRRLFKSSNLQMSIQSHTSGPAPDKVCLEFVCH